MMAADKQRATIIAEEVFGLLGSGRQVPTFTSRYPDLTLAEAYEAGDSLRALRIAAGDAVVGRKIGFTNRTVWADFGIAAPISGPMYRSTVRTLADANDRFSLKGLSEPRIEPEIALHLAKAPSADMDDAELFACVDWICHGFEMVHSIFPGWVLAAADAVAAFGVHAALLIGPPHAVANDRADWAEALQTFTIELKRNGETVARGGGRDVLGGPVQALRFLVADLAARPGRAPLTAGDLVTTGTLTKALPAMPGETWTTVLHGIDIAGLTIRFE